MNAHKHHKNNAAKMAGVFLLVFVVIGSAVYFLKDMLGQPVASQKKAAPPITVITPPPPPPPKEEPPPPPPPQEEVKLPEPEQAPEPQAPEEASNEPPPGADLGVDADAGAGGDSFGLIGKKGGRGLLSGDPFANFKSALKEAVYEQLAEVKEIRKDSYKVQVKAWFDLNGKVTKVKLESSTGKPALDKALQLNLDKKVVGIKIAMAPPPDKQDTPVTVLISSRL
ncbi:MAG TPA: TonB C-terminal domain-containing protein [Pseudomonadales bacterium]|nr:TonB C-terminal domain-containing protein [Pseudomonadales bacterium]